MTPDVSKGTLWTEDVGVLLRHPDQFFPSARLSQAENANALVRLSFYIGVSIAFLRGKISPAIAGLVVGLAITFLFARRERECLKKKATSETCRPPTLANPMMNKPVVTDIEDSLRMPCTDAPSLQKADAYSKAYMARDVDDVLGSHYENREFIVLPDGGSGPDFSKLGYQLAQGSSVRDF